METAARPSVLVQGAKMVQGVPPRGMVSWCVCVCVWNECIVLCVDPTVWCEYEQ